VQVNSAKLHGGLLRVKAGSHLNFSPAASTRRGGPSDDYHSGRASFYWPVDGTCPQWRGCHWPPAGAERL